jgi:hypothetical protein
MTEAEWLRLADPEPLLVFLKGRHSDRQCRMLAIACCRRIWHILDASTQHLVEVAERFVEGMSRARTMTFSTELRRRLGDLYTNEMHQGRPYSSSRMVAVIVHEIVAGAAWPLAWNAVSEVRVALRDGPVTPDIYQESKAQAGLVRDIFGNPFRVATLDPVWLQWNGGTVRKIAQSIYDDRAFDRMPILAAALEEAGCTDQAILDHCRGHGPHVRGCWVVDLLLGKE